MDDSRQTSDAGQALDPLSEEVSVAAIAQEEEGGLPSSGALSDWIMFLQGPCTPYFVANRRFDNEWVRVFKLVLLVLLMIVAIVLGFSLGSAGTEAAWKEWATRVRYLLLVLVAVAALAVPYAFVLAPILRIRITFVQTFFTVLFLGLPWLPLLTLVWAIGYVTDHGLVVVIFLYVLAIVPVVNFCKGVAMIADCRLWRPLVSLMIPLFIGLVIFVANKVF